MRNQAEAAAAAEREKQQLLEAELAAVRAQLDSVRMGLSGAASPMQGTPGAYFAERSAMPGGSASDANPYASVGGSSYDASPYQASYSAPAYSAPAPAASKGIDAYYCERLHTLLGDKLDMHNLLEAPGVRGPRLFRACAVGALSPCLAQVTVEEAFVAVLGTLGGDASVPWIVTDDHWSYDLNKSHFHNLLQTASQKVSCLPSRSRTPRLPAAIETVGCCRGTNLTSTC
jgi:hypothetical protein